MRSYTNKSGEKVTVSEEHLRTAISIKKELQKASPSRKASMKQLVDMMEREGFYDADTNESYRCMLKSYQKSIGELPEAPKHAEMVAEGKLESIKELVGEVAYEKQSNQKVLRELNKVKRDVIDYVLIAEQIGEVFSNYNFNFNTDVMEKKEESSKKMIMQLSDLHIGSLADNKYNKFNYEIAKIRMKEFTSKVISECKKNNINSVYVVQTGDEIEHFQMHTTQAFEAEMTLAEQIVKTSDLIINTLVTLADNGIQVRFSGIAGNHSRLNSDKNKSQHGDTSTTIINEAVKSFVHNSKIKSIEYVEATGAYEHSFNINGLNIKALHGDRDNLKNENILFRHSELDDINYDLIIGGHIHTRWFSEVSKGKFVAIAGSLKGVDNYSVDTLRKISSPSQNYYIISEEGEVEIKWVTLN